MRPSIRPHAALRMGLTCLILAPLSGAAGCASVLGRAIDRHDYLPPVYPGVAADVEVIQDACSHRSSKSPLWGVAAVIDLPLSAALDTALLPIDLLIAAAPER